MHNISFMFSLRFVHYTKPLSTLLIDCTRRYLKKSSQKCMGKYFAIALSMGVIKLGKPPINMFVGTVCECVRVCVCVSSQINLAWYLVE